MNTITALLVVLLVPANATSATQGIGQGDTAWAESVTAEVIRLENEDSRRAAKRALVEIGAPAVPALIAALEHRDAEVRKAVVKTLVEIGAPAVPALIAALEHPDAEVRKAVVKTLGDMGTTALVAVADLGLVLKDDPEAEVRIAAAEAIAEIRPAVTSAVPELLVALEDPDQDVRRAALRALRELRPEAELFCPLAAELLDDPALAKEAVDILVELGEPAVAPLAEALTHPDPGVREDAAEALGEMGAAAGEAVPSLSRALDDPERWVRVAAAEALGDIGLASAIAVDSLHSKLEDASDSVRSTALAAFASLAPEDERLLSALIEGFDDPSSHVRFEAAAAFHRMEDPPAEVIPVLIGAFERFEREEPMPAVRAKLAEALGALGPRATDAVPALVASLERSLEGEGNIGVMTAAIDAVVKIGSEDGLPVLEALTHYSFPRYGYKIRAHARDALAELQQTLGAKPSGPKQADPCSQGCEDTIAYRCHCPTSPACRERDGNLYCCDYLCKGRSTAGALDVCTRLCGRNIYGKCHGISVDDLSLDRLSEHLGEGEDLVAVGQEDVSEWERATADARRESGNEVQVPDPDDLEKTGINPDVKSRTVKLRPGTQLGGSTFMGVSGGSIFLKRCNTKLRRTVIVKISAKEFFYSLANDAASDPSLRELLRNILRTQHQP